MAEPSAGLIAVWPFWSFIASLPLPVPRDGQMLALAVLATSAVQFAAYGCAIFLVWKQPHSRRCLAIVVGTALLLVLSAVCALPNVNRDIYNYILSGRVAAVYGANPYQMAPDLFSADPLYQYASPRYTGIAGDNKLPVWTLLNAVLAGLGGDDPVRNLLIYRSVFLLFNIANLVVIASILWKVQPERLLAGLVVYGWNPVVTVHGQSKVDTVMVFLLLLAVLAFVYEKRRLGVIALALSALVKLLTLPLIAVYWLALVRARAWRTLAVSMLLVGLAVVALYAPFWYGPELITAQASQLGGVASAAPSLARLLLYGVFACAVVLVGLSRDERIESLLFGWALVLVLLALLVTKLGFSWYLLTLIALTSLVAEPRITLLVISLSFASFFMNAWDSASNDVIDLPMLFAAPRFYVQLLFVGASALGLAAFEFALRARQRRTRIGRQRTPNYGIERW
ncbi:MAG TPA: hypothetical protein VFU22_23450 [Roseiflexaceae bacterium]|nr:hypothetical protein [Roseiflexaceae bacterium]